MADLDKKTDTVDSMPDEEYAERLVHQREHLHEDHKRTIEDAGYWVGSDGVIHNAGAAIATIFVGQDTGRKISSFFGGLEDQGINALDKNGK